MRVLVSNEITGEAFNVVVPKGKNPVRIGNGAANDVVLASNYVPAEAGVIRNDGDGVGWRFWPLFEGCEIGNEPMLAGASAVIVNEQPLSVPPFSLTIYLDPGDETPTDDRRERTLDDRCANVVNELHRSLLTTADRSAGSGRGSDEETLTDEYILRLEQQIEALASRTPGLPETDLTSTELGDHFAGANARSLLLRRLIEHSGQFGHLDNGPLNRTPWSLLRSLTPGSERQAERHLAMLFTRMELNSRGDLSKQVKSLEQGFWPAWREYVDSIPVDIRRYMCLSQIKKELKDIWYGLGPLEDLLENPTITEIMVNDPENIFIEKAGVIENSGRRFVKDLTDIIQRIVTRVHRKIDTSSPMVDARLEDGSRVNAIIKPLTVTGPCLTIRRFPQKPLDCEQLIRLGSLTPSVRDFLRAAVVLRCNILVAGGTGTGKTTLLNALSGFIPDKERIITIEDTAELRLAKAHVVSLETKQKNVEGTGAVDIRMLVKNALRMRPDRIVVGECRSGEALDMLQAMNTGHDGSMTTIHANAPEDVVMRLEVMVQQNADTNLPVSSIHRQIGTALDLIVQLQGEIVEDPNRPGERFRRRVISEIVEVVDVDPELGGLRMKPIFKRWPNGDLRPTGFLPTFVDGLITVGGFDLDTLLNVGTEAA